MSNLSDLMTWAVQQDAAGTLPALSVIEAALAGAKTYPANGTQVAPGVTLIDAANGLFHLSALDAKAPGQLFCAYPGLASLDPKGQGAATVEENTANAAQSSGLGFWVRVRPMVPQDSSARAWVFAPLVNRQVPWLANAWSVSNEYQTWDQVTEYLLNKWILPS